ncbi:MAG: hypothetical protein MI784_07255, partial [Cytophagales bacterium]|nr:hypothetical protein [Cytophagales bacterium]
PTVSNKVLYGGRFGDLIGALPIGYRFSAKQLWNDYKASASNLKLAGDKIMVTDDKQPGTYESVEIPLRASVNIDKAQLFAEAKHHIEGWANARVDKYAYEAPDPAKNQRSASIIEFSWKKNGAWTGWQDVEVNRELEGLEQVSAFKIRFTLRKDLTA